MSAEILILTLLFLFAINAPIAVAIGVASIAAIIVQGNFPLMMVVQRMFGGTDSFHLMAVPLFMYAGVIMEKGGISRRIIDFANALVGWLPGGLASVTIVSAMFFAGISGSAAADAAAVGAILIPAMKKSGYESDFAAAVQASGGAIGVIIPPSIPMIIFGFLTGASIGRLFAAGILPGVLIGVSLMAVSTVISRQRGYGATARFSMADIWRTFRRALLSLGAPLIILGGILFGIFTATESAAVAVVYALVVGMAVYRNIRLKDLFPIFRDGSITASIVMFIIATASVFSWIAAIEDIPARLAGGPARRNGRSGAAAASGQPGAACRRNIRRDHGGPDSAGAHDHGDAAVPWDRYHPVGGHRGHQSGHRHADAAHGDLPDRVRFHLRGFPLGHQPSGAAVSGGPDRGSFGDQLFFPTHHVAGGAGRPIGPLLGGHFFFFEAASSAFAASASSSS